MESSAGSEASSRAVEEDNSNEGEEGGSELRMFDRFVGLDKSLAEGAGEEEAWNASSRVFEKNGDEALVRGGEDDEAVQYTLNEYASHLERGEQDLHSCL